MKKILCRPFQTTGTGVAVNHAKGRVSALEEGGPFRFVGDHYSVQIQSVHFKKINKKKNTVDFTRAKNCIHCKHLADSIECTVRKYVENDRCHKEMRVIYIGEHNCTPRAVEKKTPKEDVESVLPVKPTITPGALQIDKVREALLSGKDANEVNNVAMEYSNKRHLKFLHKSIKQKTCPGGKDIEAIHVLKEDFVKRGLDENLILEVGEDYVIL